MSATVACLSCGHQWQAGVPLDQTPCPSCGVMLAERDSAQIGPILWSYDHDDAEKRYRASIEPHGVVVQIVARDPSRHTDDDNNALLFVRDPGKTEFRLFGAFVHPEAGARVGDAFILRNYVS